MSIIGDIYEEQIYDMRVEMEEMKSLLEECYWTLSGNSVKKSDPFDLALRIRKFVNDDRTRI